MISVNSSWNIVNFRSGLISYLVSQGHEILCIVPYDDYSKKIKDLNCNVRFINLKPKSKNIFTDIFLLYDYIISFIRFKPCVYFGFTIKPNIYGSLVSSLLNVPYVNNIAGLGQLFSDNYFIKYLACIMYKVSLFNSSRIFFQNKDDLNYFTKLCLVNNKLVSILPGSGVDTSKFSFVRLPNNERLRFSMISRLLWAKGVKEFEEASIIIKSRCYKADFYLFGFTDNTYGSVTDNDLKEIINNGNLIYGGRTDNVSHQIGLSDCIVLPTFYNEGTPRILLEGASMGRPLITTNTKGCKNVVIHGKNGFLCEPKDSVDLANQIEKLILMSNYERMKFGLRGRKKMVLDYNENIVIRKYEKCINNIMRLNFHKKI